MIDEYTRDGYWTDETFYDFYERNAREFGDREALVDSKYRLTWSQAKRLVDGIAQSWVKMGIPKDARIIIQSPNSVYGFLARVASERAGLISLTVYPYLRERELEHFVEKTQAEAVIICYIYRNFNYLEMYKGLQARFPFLKHIFLFEETVPAEAPANTYSLVKLAEESLTQPVDEALLKSRRFEAKGDIGLLTSTTGTTGLPKLVEWPLAPRVCTSKGRVGIWKEKATAIGVVPTHLVRMLEVDTSKYDLSSLRFIRSAGGYLSPQVAEEAEKAFGASITSDLGTQDVGSVSGCSVEDSKDLRRRTVGRMLPGNRVILKDEQGNPVPDGEPGILWFRGPHAPAGYYRDPELTATVFDKDGWTTTGDIVKFDQGCLWILGRAKDMIIRGGQNIYPAEIEGLLNGHPSVASVAIVGYPDREMGERACAYVVLKAGQTLTFEEMKTFLKEKKISAYKLPERLEIVAALPTVGDSGKIDKKVLKTQIEELVKAGK